MKLVNTALIGLCLFSLIFPNQIFGQESIFARSEFVAGLNKISFNTSHGTVVVYLPSVLAAGDNISGTIVTMPLGITDEIKSMNMNVLKSYYLVIENTRIPVSTKVINWNIAKDMLFPETYIMLKDKTGNVVSSIFLQIDSEQLSVIRPSKPSPWEYQCPMIGRAGREVQINGPFDGDFATTSVKVGGRDAIILAESPRVLVFQSPEDILGVTELELIERGVNVKRKFQNLSVVSVKQKPLSVGSGYAQKAELLERQKGAGQEKLYSEQRVYPSDKIAEAELSYAQIKVGEILKEEETYSLDVSEESLKKPEPANGKEEKITSIADIKAPSERSSKPAPKPLSMAKSTTKEVAAVPLPKDALPPMERIAEFPDIRGLALAGESEKKAISTKEINARGSAGSSIAKTGEYTVQVAAYKKKSEAVELSEKLKSMGYKAYVVTAKVPGKGTWNRVRIGSFKTRTEAERFGHEIRSREPIVKSVFVAIVK